MCVSTEPAPALPQLSALMGVPYSDLGPWLDSVSASSPQLPQQWPIGQSDHLNSQLQDQQLISLATFAAADAGKVICSRKLPIISCLRLCFDCSLCSAAHQQQLQVWLLPCNEFNDCNVYNARCCCVPLACDAAQLSNTCL